MTFYSSNSSNSTTTLDEWWFKPLMTTFAIDDINDLINFYTPLGVTPGLSSYLPCHNDILLDPGFIEDSTSNYSFNDNELQLSGINAYQIQNQQTSPSAQLSNIYQVDSNELFTKQNSRTFSQIKSPESSSNRLELNSQFVDSPNELDDWSPSNQTKRPRRRHDELPLTFHCRFDGCNKSYSTISNLNAHITKKQHGPKQCSASYPTPKLDV